MKGTLSIGAIQLILACALSAALIKPVQDRLDEMAAAMAQPARK